MHKSLPDHRRLLSSWLLELRASGKADQTIRSYKRSVEGFLKHSETLDKGRVVEWLAAMADSEPASVKVRLAGLKQYAKWLAREEDFDADAILLVQAPPLRQKPVDAVSDGDIAKLLRACAGRDWRDRRDTAMFMMLRDTGMRRGELLGLDAEDVDLTNRTATIRRAKGNKSRASRFGAETAVAVDRYQRLTKAYSGALWQGNKGTRLSVSGLIHIFSQRAAQAGVQFHAHQFRHSMAVRWKAAGGSDGGLMAQAGWSSREMIDRYTGAAKEQLAHQEFDRLFG
jgi:site-specific recombinase XerD